MIEELIFSLIAFLAGIFFMFYGFDMYKRYQLIRDTPTSNVQSISLGTVELKGLVRTSNEESTYKHPIEDKECVYYKRKVEKYDYDDDGSNWKHIDTEEVGDEFYLEDDTGSVLVKIEDPDVDLEDDARTRQKYNIGPDDEVPRALEDTRAGNDSFLPDVLEGSEKYRVTVESIYPEMFLYLFGHARSRELDEAFSKNEKNIIIGNAEESNSSNSSLSSLPLLGKSNPFIIANQPEDELIKERKYIGPGSFFSGLILSALGLYWFLYILRPILGF